MSKEYVITVDLGGTKILSALLNKKKEIVERVKVPTDAKKGADFIVDCIADSVFQLIHKAGIKTDNIKALALGVPGTVNPESGVIAIAPNLEIKDYNIKKAISKYFDIPVLLENDVNMAGLGIKNFEYKNNVNNMMVIFIGTGIGGALFFNGNMYRGSSFYAGEIGHILVKSDGSLDGDTGKTSFENIASRTAIVNAIISKSKKEETTLKELIKSGAKIKSKHLQKAIKKNDKLVIKEVEKACKVIGSVLGSMTTFLNLDLIVVGGGLVEANEDFVMSRIKKSFDSSVISPCKKVVKLKSTKLGDDAPLYGGLGLVEEFMDNKK